MHPPICQRVLLQFNDNVKLIQGLKVMEGQFIPAWAVICKYTGMVMTKKMMNKESLYVVEIDKTTTIDATKEGNVIKYIDHTCKDFNMVFISVPAGSKDRVFVRSIKPIQEHEFLSLHYGSYYHKFFPHCLCETCCPKIFLIDIKVIVNESNCPRLNNGYVLSIPIGTFLTCSKVVFLISVCKTTLQPDQ